MKAKLILKAGGFALAATLGFMATPGIAQTAYDANGNPIPVAPGYDVPQPSEVPTPRGSEDPYMDTQPRGAQGPIRSDESSHYYQDSSRYRDPESYRRAWDPRYAGQPGYRGFLEFQQRGTNSP